MCSLFFFCQCGCEIGFNFIHSSLRVRVRPKCHFWGEGDQMTPFDLYFLVYPSSKYKDSFAKPRDPW